MSCDNSNTESLLSNEVIKQTEQGFCSISKDFLSLYSQKAIKERGQGLPPPPRYQIKAVPIGTKLYKDFDNPVRLWDTVTGLALDEVFELEEAQKLVERSRNCPPMVDTKPKDCFWRHENTWSTRAIKRNYQLSLNLNQGVDQ